MGSEIFIFRLDNTDTIVVVLKALYTFMIEAILKYCSDYTMEK